MKIVNSFAITCLLFVYMVLLTGCNGDKTTTTEEAPSNQPQLFESRTSEQTGIRFQNDVKESNNLSTINFSYLYIGGAVGIGDFNNDGLPDVYFVATQGENKLYLNKGQLQFEDITARAGVAAGEGIKMGVTVADVNADGFLDIYVCRTGRDTDKRENLLFINNQDLTFTEQAQAYGLADSSASNHASTFATTYFENDGKGKFRARALPIAAQFAPVNRILADDFDGDGQPDLLLAGNHLGMEVETGRCDASYGVFLKGDGKGNFTPVPNRMCGFWAPQEVRALAQIRNKDKRPFVVVGNNNGPLQVFQY